MGRVRPEIMTPVCVTAKGPCRSHKCTNTQTHTHWRRSREGGTKWKRDIIPIASSLSICNIVGFYSPKLQEDLKAVISNTNVGFVRLYEENDLLGGLLTRCSGDSFFFSVFVSGAILEWSRVKSVLSGAGWRGEVLSAGEHIMNSSTSSDSSCLHSAHMLCFGLVVVYL